MITDRTPKIKMWKIAIEDEKTVNPIAYFVLRSDALKALKDMSYVHPDNDYKEGAMEFNSKGLNFRISLMEIECSDFKLRIAIKKQIHERIFELSGYDTTDDGDYEGVLRRNRMKEEL